MKLLRENLFLRFSVISFVAMAVIGVALAIILSNTIQSHAIEALVDEAIADSSGRLLSKITPADLEVPMIGERYDSFHEFVQDSIVSERTARVKLWAKDGTVIYSNDPMSVGEKFPDNENLLAALRGENATSIKIPEDPENERERFLGTLIEVYTPIILPGANEPQGVFEIYQYYQPTEQLINNLRRGVFASIGVGFVALYGTLVYSVWGGWRTIVRQGKERQQAEEEKEKIQSQLRESQKMEAVGVLAGGVAHDFNNLLTAILGYSELALASLGGNEPVRKDIEEVEAAAKRAASLTRQLLTFSRREVLQPRILNLNALVTNIEKMLRRLIGEDIELVTVLEPKLRSIKADPGQIEQVVMNLVINAKDAMTKGGKITIKTENVTVKEEYRRSYPDARTGEFATLVVEDTGTGIDKEVIRHIFEPFFTTKESGKGTGLGLSVTYGIVRQHEGWINVYSEPGQGATFRAYLPVIPVEATEQTDENASTDQFKGNGERVLVVEDQDGVREYAARVLGENGYVGFEAASAREALDIFGKEQGKFHLVFSDVVLPDKNGLELADQLRSLKPQLPILMTSGYTDQKAHWPVIQERGFRFLQKPYSVTDLLQAIKETMEQARQ